MTTASVAVTGAYGAVGTEAVRHLRALGVAPIRVGGRDLGRAQQLLDGELDGNGEAMVLDVLDPDALASFCAGCSVVLNCAGPAVAVGDSVARAALAAGSDYVDAAGDDPLLARIAGVLPPGRRVLLSAGMMPGLTGLLPRHFGPVRGGRLRAYIGGRDRFSATAAVDYLAAGAEFGQPRIAWRLGRRVPALATLSCTPPYFPEPVTALPYLGVETERLAAELGLAEVDWFSVFAGARVAHILSRSTGGRDGASALCRAAAVDLFGHRPYQLLVFELTHLGTRTLMLRGTGASALTGAMAALAVVAVLDRTVPEGAWHASEVLDAGAVAKVLPTLPAVTQFDLVTGSVPEPEYVEVTL
jgi:Saccharopine dehydrogenase NADP binding domain